MTNTPDSSPESAQRLETLQTLYHELMSGWSPTPIFDQLEWEKQQAGETADAPLTEAELAGMGGEFLATLIEEDDADLIGHLGAIAAAVDPVPAQVLEDARSAFGTADERSRIV